MKIGFKYCGGCNPRYDRQALYEEFKSKVDNSMEICVSRDKGNYDFLIVLAGCPNACADCSRIVFEKEKIVFTEYKQADDIIKRITE